MPSYNAPMRISSSNGTLTGFALVVGNGSRIGSFGRIYNYCKSKGSPNPFICALGGPPNGALIQSYSNLYSNYNIQNPRYRQYLFSNF